jgi:hypothetical protein
MGPRSRVCGKEFGQAPVHPATIGLRYSSAAQLVVRHVYTLLHFG